MRPSIVRLPAAATSTLPRWILLAICAVYVAAGLFRRDPWKNEDATGFGIMWTLANGGWHDWLLPNLAGKAMTLSGPLMYWLGAASIRLLSSFSPWLDASDAAHLVTGLLFYSACLFVWYGSYLLGRRREVQPFKYAFGGEPSPTDYGRTIADGALLILLGCFGLAERGHETTPEIAQFTCIAMLIYGLIRSLDKPVQGALWWGLALGLLSLAANPVLVLALLVGTLALAFWIKELLPCRLLGLGLPIFITLAVSWPIAANLILAEPARHYLYAWSIGNLSGFTGPFTNSLDPLFYLLKNLPLFSWPAWPLAAWSWYSWATLRRAPHISIPVAIISPLLIAILLQSYATNRLFILLLPGLAILAAFGLPTLKRGAINAMDWFALLSFTLLSSFVWLVWIAALTGFPRPLAHNLARLLPGFYAEFSALALALALLVTACWIMLVRWRLARAPKVLWRSVILSSVGTTLMWVLLMTLWLPFINYSRTYRDVALQISARLPSSYQCISPIRLGDAQLASFTYFGKMRFGFGEQKCDVLLRQDTADYGEPASPRPYRWQLVWEGHRPADRKERFRLYVLTERK